VAASLKDVAGRAGVSIKTVSNVVNGHPSVRPETRARVQRALDELGYRPNLSARQLRGGRTGLIALAVPEISLPYFAELAELIVAQATVRGWTVLIEATHGERGAERNAVQGIRSHLVDGMILSPLGLRGGDVEQRRETTPLVLLGERLTDLAVDHVMIDNEAAARAVTSHLAAGLGRRRVAAIGAQPHIKEGTATPRLRGYREALARAGLPYDHELVVPVERYHRADGAAAMARLLDAPSPPDAVFCFNDTLALGALRMLLQRGARVPGDIALAGFDDIEDARFCTPSLTTIAPDKQRIAELAIALLDTRIGEARLGTGQPTAPKTAFTDFSLLIRESTIGR
jgi:DNA-binding LacI/PurR family transcriptional regulator